MQAPSGNLDTLLGSSDVSCKFPLYIKQTHPIMRETAKNLIFTIPQGCKSIADIKPREAEQLNLRGVFPPSSF